MMIDWSRFLTCWSLELMSTELAARVDPPPVSTDWLGTAPATDDEIAHLEERLGAILPDSYKAFLRTSNGWARTTPFVDRIRATQDVEWFRTENEQWIEVYSASGYRIRDAKYYVYSEEGAAEYRAKHLASVLQISDVDDGVYLLNPEAVTPDGEWEAWFFANWLPGAKRFPSFAHLMLHEYRMFAGLYELEPTDFGLQALTSFPADVPRVAADRTPTKSRTAPSLETLIEQMRSTDAKLRAKAVRVFLGQLKGRRNAARPADLVGPLTDLFHDSKDAAVRAACISALTELAEDEQPPAPLLEALSDSDPGVVLTGIFASPISRIGGPSNRFAGLSTLGPMFCSMRTRCVNSEKWGTKGPCPLSSMCCSTSTTSSTKVSAPLRLRLRGVVPLDSMHW